MIKNIELKKVWFDSVRDESLTFLIVDNTELQLNRGDLLNISYLGDQRQTIHARVIFVTSYALSPGWVAFSFSEISASAMISSNNTSGLNAAITHAGLANRQSTGLEFYSEEDAADYQRLTRKMNENKSQATIKMRLRYNDFKKQRDEIKIKNKGKTPSA